VSSDKNLLVPAIYIRFITALIILLSVISCRKTENPFGDTLVLLAWYSLPISETSGLSYYNRDDRLLTVSDLTGRVYIISTLGEVLDSLTYQGKDPEGVAFDRNNSIIFVAEEKLNEVVELDTLGNEVNRFKVELGNLIQKHGLEGITYNPITGNLLLVSEKLPGLLIEVTRAGVEVSRRVLSFALDYSSVFFDPHNSSLWILSDESETLTRVDTTGSPIKTWKTGIKKGEGLVVDSKNGLVYIVTDDDSRLHVFKIVL
jgi:uncharacterized protein YjiK